VTVTIHTINIRAEWHLTVLKQLSSERLYVRYLSVSLTVGNVEAALDNVRRCISLYANYCSASDVGSMGTAVLNVSRYAATVSRRLHHLAKSHHKSAAGVGPLQNRQK